jgi:murein DD-endopeptidase MepM/ murein hydrolase activator NlpD
MGNKGIIGFGVFVLVLLLAAPVLSVLLIPLLGGELSKNSSPSQQENTDNGLVPAQQMFKSYYEAAEKKYGIPWNILAAVHFMDPIFSRHSQLGGNARCKVVTLTNANEKKYEALINKYAAEQGIDACFFAAMIKQESGFNPEAKSYVGAMGLTQVMPDKCPDYNGDGNPLLKKYTDKSVILTPEEKRKCKEPEENIKRGAKYAKAMQSKPWINGDLDLMAAAYNAGPWALCPNLNCDGVKVGTVPNYPETRNHVKVVRANYNQYVSQSNVTPVDKSKDKATVTMADVDKWIDTKAKELAGWKKKHEGANDACVKKLKAKQDDYSLGSYGFEMSCAIYDQAPTAYESESSKLNYVSQVEQYANQYTGNNPIFGGGTPYIRGAKFPYPTYETKVRSPFSSSRLDPVTKAFYKPHTGVDFAVPMGTPVKAVADGEIIFAGWAGGYGNAIQVLHGGADKISTTYNHLSQILIRSGPVKKNQVIGKVGSTGNSTGPHLHFEVRVNTERLSPQRIKGSPVNPIGYLDPSKK